jgi:hypothetical protein
MTEGEVMQALRLFMGRQLCDRCGMEPDDAMAYVIYHEIDILDAMEDAVEAHHSANHIDDDDEED